MMDLRDSILEVIRDNEETVAPFLGTRARRTHAFLAKRQRTIPEEQRVFSQYGNDGFQPCIITQVYERRYPHKAYDSLAPNNKCVNIENWVDCTYLARPREFDTYGFPVAWEYDLAIEVENDIAEFAMTLRTLLDFVANNRVGIFFFSNQPDELISRLTDEFLKSWAPFGSKYGFAKDLRLHVIFFPESYTSFSAYAGSSRSFDWDPAKLSFCSC